MGCRGVGAPSARAPRCGAGGSEMDGQVHIMDVVAAVRNNEDPARCTTEGCTPFIGAGLSAAAYPRLTEVVPSLAEAMSIPPWIPRRLHIISEFLAVQLIDPLAPKKKVVEIIDREASRDAPRDEDAWEAMLDLARLPFPLYITTNYDDLLERALEEVGRTPIRLVSNWFDGDRALFAEHFPEALEVHELQRGPRPERAVVFHLHGWQGLPRSMVLTEEDYVDFLIAFSKSKQQGVEPITGGKPAMIPPYVEHAFGNHKLLLVGYGMEDINFRVLLRAIRDVQPHRRPSLSIQLQPSQAAVCQQIVSNALGSFLSGHARMNEVTPKRLRDVAARSFESAVKALPQHMESHTDYLHDFFRSELKVNVVWQDASKFITQLSAEFRRPGGQA